MKHVLAACLCIVGVIHLLPLSGALSAERLAALYGLRFDESNLAILMRHRAVLFGLLGAYLIYAAFQPTHQATGLIAAWVSVLSFLYIAWSVGSYNAAVHRVVWADIIATISLLIATVVYASLKRDG
jgi:riboflavin transporter FmnP